ncbi:MAG: Chemotaxis response regulator protein-glutamate methylesterase [Luteibacter sp.]|uniref:chemotaxis protein CheB n=1 Tax=Luteibacter sp. TaxID=1886636 RepID=UPI00137C90FB|nr:chemotaxis protein CheB [Luteibacter sp.]KAF1006664.1 MAG: Chemotaxis response regulator protein-glutamate methylesterase [Luteibacter sp.]
MAERGTAVALLFDDATLSAHLRDALLEQGASIVYASDLASFAPAVVVVDLDNPGDDDLDRLYDTVESGHPRLVFNDADASRHLSGWDRARWARHLAAKLVGGTVLDPPRPEDARAIEPRIEAIASPAAPVEEFFLEPLTAELAITGSHGYPDSTDAPADAPVDDDLAGDLDFSTTLPVNDDGDDDSGHLAAELEALLAEGDMSLPGHDSLEDVPSTPVELNELASLSLSSFELVDEAPPAPVAEHRDFDLSGLSLDAPGELPPSSLQIEGRATEYVPPPVPEWDLVDHDQIVPEPVAAKPDASEFGIETVSAVEYLAQDVVDDGSVDIRPGLTLELESMEEAIAPTARSGDYVHEMFLDESARAVRRVVALAGAVESASTIADFLAAAPARLPAVLLVVAHHEGDSEAFAASLGKARVAVQGMHANHGDVLVVARGEHVQIRRDGSVSVREDGIAGGPSIDGVLSTLAGGFGADAMAIVFAGRGNDAVAGSQAIYDAGGRVWVETVPAEQEYGQMVSGVREERVAGFAGDVPALVRKLTEELR